MAVTLLEDFQPAIGSSGGVRRLWHFPYPFLSFSVCVFFTTFSVSADYTAQNGDRHDRMWNRSSVIQSTVTRHLPVLNNANN
jgi:hypothetical protein